MSLRILLKGDIPLLLIDDLVDLLKGLEDNVKKTNCTKFYTGFQVYFSNDLKEVEFVLLNDISRICLLKDLRILLNVSSTAFNVGYKSDYDNESKMFKFVFG